MCISLVTLSTSDWSFILSFSRILIATFSPVSRWVPSLTFPKVPWPRDLPLDINYLFMKLTNYIMSNLSVICSSLGFLLLILCILFLLSLRCSIILIRFSFICFLIWGCLITCLLIVYHCNIYLFQDFINYLLIL